MIFAQRKSDIIGMLRYIKNSKDAPLITIKNQIGSSKNSRFDVSVKGAKLLFVTQLLSAAHPDRYVVMDDNIPKALKDLQITDIIVNQMALIVTSI